MAKIAAAGAIPPLVALLGPHTSAEVKMAAALALCSLAANDDNKIKIRTAGAVGALNRMLHSDRNEMVKSTARNALKMIIDERLSGGAHRCIC